MASSTLAITTATLGHPPLRDLVRVVAGAGIGGICIWPEADWAQALATGWSPGAIRRLLSDHDLDVWEAEAAVVWVGDADPGPPYFEEPPRRLLYEAAVGSGATAILAVMIGDRAAAASTVAEAFAGLCSEAAEHGLRVHLEFALGTQVRSLTEAVGIVQQAGAPNAGIVVDTWAMHWGPSRIEDLSAVPPELIATVQLNDAPLERPADYADATRYGRLRPGHGGANVRALLHSLRATGADPRFVLEVLNPALANHAGAAAFASLLANDARDLGVTASP